MRFLYGSTLCADSFVCRAFCRGSHGRICAVAVQVTIGTRCLTGSGVMRLLYGTSVTSMQSRNANAIPKDAIVASGSAQGMEGPVKVEVAFSQDKIYSVTVTEANETTPDIGTKAIDALPGTIVAENSLNVDAVSGATITSTAIKNAAAQAMSDAGVDPSAFGYAGEASAETEAAETYAL